jgi:hypothetical protein
MGADIQALLNMLTYKRPAGTYTEEQFIKRFIAPLGARPDPFGNRILRIGPRAKQRILWSAHTDTVHKWPGRQRVEMDQHGIIRAVSSDCLGADNAGGVWLLTELAKARVPGLYVFHRAEEIGCQGSSYILGTMPELLDGIDAAIAFDRRGTDSIVTFQCGQRTASDEFAWSLARALGIDTLGPDPTGVFTDTEVYRGIVPECTNVSIGYDSGHSPKEWLDLAWIVALRDALVRADLSQLAIKRDPTVKDEEGDRWWTEYSWSSEGGKEQKSFVCALCEHEILGDKPHMMAGHEVCEFCWDDSFDQ